MGNSAVELDVGIDTDVDLDTGVDTDVDVAEVTLSCSLAEACTSCYHSSDAAVAGNTLRFELWYWSD